MYSPGHNRTPSDPIINNPMNYNHKRTPSSDSSGSHANGCPVPQQKVPLSTSLPTSLGTNLGIVLSLVCANSVLKWIGTIITWACPFFYYYFMKLNFSLSLIRMVIRNILRVLGFALWIVLLTISSAKILINSVKFSTNLYLKVVLCLFSFKLFAYLPYFVSGAICTWVYCLV